MFTDLHRPRYHVLPSAHWLNDPNGLIHWRGQYHLFYQYNPHGAFHGTIHWGHAVSADLAHWQHLPIALRPDQSYDQAGVWSGCAVDNNGVPTLLYTGVHPQRQCLAWSEDNLLTWKKRPAPVLAAPLTDLPLVSGTHGPEWRDPWVWRENETWYMLLGAGVRDVGGTALLYASADLEHWTYLNPILVGDRAVTGEVWECPNLFPLGNQHTFLFSPVPEATYTYYFTGTYTAQRFTPFAQGKADYGPYFYAAQTMRDDQQRRLMWGWIKEGRTNEAQRAAGWSGAMSLPRILDLAPDGMLRQTPAPELAKLRGQHWCWENLLITAESPPLFNSPCAEILAHFAPGDAHRFGLWIYASEAECTLIAFDVAQHALIVDRVHSSLAVDVDQDVQTVPLPPTAPFALRVFLDHSIVEIFVGAHLCFSTRLYPTHPASTGIRPVAFGGHAHLLALDLWTMKSIWTSAEDDSLQPHNAHL